MLLELGKGLLRVGLKKAAEYEMRSNNKEVGAMVGIFNAITEQADTRQWQTLPHSIYYTRIPLKEGKQKITFTMNGNKGNNKIDELDFEIKKGITYFHTYTSIDTYGTGFY